MDDIVKYYREEIKIYPTCDVCRFRFDSHRALCVYILKKSQFSNVLAPCSEYIFYLVDEYLSLFKKEHLFNGALMIGNFNTPNPRFYYMGKNGYGQISLHREFQLEDIHSILYEITHELTHFFISSTGHGQNTWVEESLAKLSSKAIIYHLAASVRKKDKCKGDSLKHTIQFGLMNEPKIKNDPKTWYNLHKSELRELCLSEVASRILQTEVAEYFLSYFQEESADIWNILFHLPKVSLSDTDFFEKWEEHCKADKTDTHVRYIRHVFGV